MLDHPLRGVADSGLDRKYHPHHARGFDSLAGSDQPGHCGAAGRGARDSYCIPRNKKSWEHAMAPRGLIPCAGQVSP